MTNPPELYAEVVNFLFAEANILDEGRLEDWLALLSEDVRYVMPVRRNLQPGTVRANDMDEAFSLFNDDKASLTVRVQRIATGSAHAEVPHSVTQRLVTNIVIEPGASDAEMRVQSSFLIYQERRGRFGATFIGKRRDRLRREGGQLRIFERRIDLAQTILPTTISILF